MLCFKDNRWNDGGHELFFAIVKSSGSIKVGNLQQEAVVLLKLLSIGEGSFSFSMMDYFKVMIC